MAQSVLQIVVIALSMVAMCDAFMLPASNTIFAGRRHLGQPFVCAKSASLMRGKRGAVHGPLLAGLKMMSDDYNSMTVADLKDVLRGLGDSPPSKLKKAELIERIQDFQNAEPKWGSSEGKVDKGVLGGGEEVNLLGAIASLEEEMAKARSQEPVKLDAGAIWGASEEPVWGEAAWGEEEEQEEGPPFVDDVDVKDDRADVPSPFMSNDSSDDTPTVGGKPLDELTVSQLKEQLKERGLKVGGVKSDLVDRLSMAMSSRARAKPTVPRREGGGAWSEGNMLETQRSGGRDQDPEWRQREWQEKSKQGQEGEERQIFVRGLPFGARPEDIVALFESAGEVERVEGMFQRNRATGRAWVTFDSGAAAAAALDLHKSEINGRYIEVYPPWSRPARQALRMISEDKQKEERQREWREEPQGRWGDDRSEGTRGESPHGRTASPYQQDRRSTSPYADQKRSGEFPPEVGAKSSSIFVGRIPLAATREEVQEAMGVCGEIIDIRMGVKNGQFQGFAHVDYADQASADAAVALGKESLEIHGREVRLDYAPARRNQSREGGDRRDGRGGRGGGRGRGRGGSGGFRGGGRGRGGGGSW